jgi:hypothetical protein
MVSMDVTSFLEYTRKRSYFLSYKALSTHSLSICLDSDGRSVLFSLRDLSRRFPYVKVRCAFQLLVLGGLQIRVTSAALLSKNE